jgi:sulfur-oxidizing protein SoxA
MPVQVQIDGPMAPFYEKGKAFYFQRRGLLDMACSNCHVDNAGNMIRANLLTQGQSNGFPLYRLKWNGVGSIHRRFRGCNSQVRSTPYAYGSDEYVNLELFVGSRGMGLPVETPAVRN